ncbi:M16 family metallopeptidase [Aerosakkonema sp. BLCC-F2]
MQNSIDRGIKRTLLKNGIVVIAVENPAADIIASRIFLRVGGRWEQRSQAGLSHLLASVLTKGTDRLTASEIAERVESLGASLGADAAADYFLLSMKTVSADFAEILELAGQLLRSPSFPETEVELERRMALQAIRSQQEQPFTVAFEQLRQAMYRDHPYAMSSLGTESSVSKLRRADLQEYHRTYFRPDNTVISIVGRIAPEDAIAQVEQVLGDWEAPATPIPTLNLPRITPIPHPSVTYQPTQQSIVMLGYLTPSVGSPDYMALKLLNTYLGNGLSSRLFVELREKRGLAYEVSAFYPTRLDWSQFAVYMGTAPENTAIALDSLRAEVDRLCKAPLAPEEFQAAQNKLLGQYALGKQTNAQIAQVYGWYEILGLGIEFDITFPEAVAAVTTEAAMDAACRYFIEPYVSLVGPAYAVDGLVEKGWQN